MSLKSFGKTEIYAANLQEKTHAEVGTATLLKSHFGISVLLYIYSIVSEKPFPKNTSGRLLLTIRRTCNKN